VKRDFLSMTDLSPAELAELLQTARRLKAQRKATQDLAGKSLGMIYQKPSTRTAASFSVAMFELGGLALPMNAQDLQMKRGESWADTARTFSRYFSGIMIRANLHSDVEELALFATIPVINGLTDKEHPCQVLADLLTVMEAFKISDPKDMKKLRVLYIGDGNNMTHSWMLAAGLLGLELVVCTPEGFDPEKSFMKKAEGLSAASGGKVVYEREPAKAAAGAHVVYTDVWASMGKDEEREHRKNVFKAYQVNAALMKVARPDAVAMHCLPAHRGEEITAEVIDGPRSVVFDEAENRLHVQKAVLLNLLK